LEDSLEYYKEQQYLYKLMLGDLENYKEAFEKARDVGTFYSPFTKMTKVKKENLNNIAMVGPGIVDLKQAMDQTKTNFEGLNN